MAKCSESASVGGPAYRYQLLRTAQSVLAVAGAEWRDQHRTCWCSRSLRHGDYGNNEGGYVQVYRNQARDGASLAGLNRCGNLHTCPVCAAKVAELRCKQLSSAMAAHIKNGQTPAQIIDKIPGSTSAYLLTFTFPHQACEHAPGEKCEFCLDALVSKFDAARRKFQNSRLWKSFKKTKQVIGVVNSLEFTVSIENGWHPHIHMLLFSDRSAFGEGAPAENGDLSSLMIDDLSRLWCDLLFKCGLGDHTKLKDMLAHALNVRGGEHAAQYIASFGRDTRWGVSSELARTHQKIGAVGQRWGVQHFSPFQLLVWAENHDGWAVHRYREYAAAVQGKRAMTWSPGLKSALNVPDVDEEIWAATDDAPRPDQILVGELTAKQFGIILSRRQLPQFINYVATCCDNQGHLDEFVDSLCDLEKISSGKLLIKTRSGRIPLDYSV